MNKSLDMAVFSERMKAKRKEKNMLQKCLADATGITKQTISAYESNGGSKGKTPTIDKVVSIADALGVSVDYLCGRDKEGVNPSRVENAGDVVESIMRIADCVPCYVEVIERHLTDEEYDRLNYDVPDVDYHTKSTPMLQLTIDNQFVADFFAWYMKLMPLLDDGTLSEEAVNSERKKRLASVRIQSAKNRAKGHGLHTLDAPVNPYEPQKSMRELRIGK